MTRAIRIHTEQRIGLDARINARCGIDGIHDVMAGGPASGIRDGRTLSSWRLHDVAISVPIHCHNVKAVSVDQELLTALIAHRRAIRADDWGQWQNSITCFNQANTDSPTNRYQVDWVLL